MSCVFLCYLAKAAIYFIISLHTVNLQRQTVKLTLQLVLECLRASFLPNCQALRRHASPDGGADTSLGSSPPWTGQGTDEHLSHLNQGEQMSQMSHPKHCRPRGREWREGRSAHNRDGSMRGPRHCGLCAGGRAKARCDGVAWDTGVLPRMDTGWQL